MKRRDFIKLSSVVTIPVFFNGFGLKAIARKPVPSINEYNDKVLVLIQMDGGNDTLNTVIPLDQYSNLSSVRSNILIPENKVLKYNDKVGFHPYMASLKEVMDEGQLNIVRAVGYPNQNRSHFRSTDIWMSGSAADVQKTTGWMGSYFSLEHADYPDGYPNDDINFPFAISMGSTASQTCQGSFGNYSIAVSDATQAGELFEGEWETTPDNCFGDQLSFVRDTVRQSNEYSDIVSEAYSKGTNMSQKYSDDNKLASNLKDVARLISGGLKTKVYVVRLGGFDTHSAQVDAVDTEKGKHGELLATLSTAIGAFQDDLNLMNLDKRVIGMTFSEFGRRIKSNASFGTDHGTAVDMFVFGSCVNPVIIGENPEISDNVDNKEAVPMQFDYRSVYGSLLIDWFEAKESEVKSILYEDFHKISIVAGCESTANEDLLPENDIEFTISPNPVYSSTTISFLSNGEQSIISLFDELGSELKVIMRTTLPQGKQTFSFDVSYLSSGVYFIRLVNSTNQITRRFVKI